MGYDVIPGVRTEASDTRMGISPGRRETRADDHVDDDEEEEEEEGWWVVGVVNERKLVMSRGDGEGEEEEEEERMDRWEDVESTGRESERDRFVAFVLIEWIGFPELDAVVRVDAAEDVAVEGEMVILLPS